MLKSKRYQSLLSGCPRCRNQPIVVLNLSQGGRAYLECPPCKFSLPDLPTEQEAVQLWEFFAIGAIRFFPMPIETEPMEDDATMVDAQGVD